MLHLSGQEVGGQLFPGQQGAGFGVRIEADQDLATLDLTHDLGYTSIERHLGCTVIGAITGDKFFDK
ncbi:MAG: hypothetical protein PVH46_04585 [Granulosicoccaceae bacterium]